MALSKKSFLGFGFESSSGTALAAPTVYHPCKSVMKGTKKREQIKDERGTRDAVYGIVDTLREGGTDPKGSWYNDTSPYLLIGALGEVSSAQPDATNVPTCYKHTISLADVPKTLTLFKNYDAALYVGAYAAIEKISLKFATDGKLLECDSTIKHLYPVKYVGSTLTPSFSTIQPFAGYMPKITLGGVQSLDIDELSIEFDQKLDLWVPPNGSPDFTTIYFGERNVKVDFTARFDTDALYNHFFNSTRTDDSLVFDVQGALIGSHLSNSYYQELNISIPVISYDSMEHDLSKTNVLIKAKATGVAGPSGLISAYVQNTVSSYAS
jgi:Phage tail tube protein